MLATGAFAKLAIADPAAAPYGAAAIQTLKPLRLYDRLQPKMVQGAYHPGLSVRGDRRGGAGFVALSQVINETGGSRWLVPATDHAPIEQQAVLLKTGAGQSGRRGLHGFPEEAAARRDHQALRLRGSLRAWKRSCLDDGQAGRASPPSC